MHGSNDIYSYDLCFSVRNTAVDKQSMMSPPMDPGLAATASVTQLRIHFSMLWLNVRVARTRQQKNCHSTTRAAGDHDDDAPHDVRRPVRAPPHHRRDDLRGLRDSPLHRRQVHTHRGRARLPRRPRGPVRDHRFRPHEARREGRLRGQEGGARLVRPVRERRVQALAVARVAIQRGRQRGQVHRRRPRGALRT